VRPVRSSVAATRASGRDRLLPPVQTVENSARRSTGRGFQFMISFHQEARPEFFRAEVRGSVVQLEINQNHPFYQKLYMHASESAENFDVLLLSAARALFDVPAEARQALLRSWSDNLLAYLAH
jgi:hypothetical protein